MLTARLVIIFSCLLVEACAWPSKPARGESGFDGKLLNSSAGALNFNWRLLGDKSVGPIQVFSDTEQIWLQWRPSQAIPIISAKLLQGEQLLEYTRRGDLIVVSGGWDHLYFRQGKKAAEAHRHRLPVPNEIVVSASAAKESVAVKATPSVTFDLRPEDLLLRRALVRWAALAGWHFLSEHWAVDVDVPISGYVSFPHPFEQSVRQLMAATELSDRPLQACFYSNRVLRVVSATQSCDPTMSREGTP